MNVPRLVTDAPLAHTWWTPSTAAKGTAVLLHGVGGGRDAWSDACGGTARALSDAGWCVAALDLPGYGDSAPAQSLTLPVMAERVLGLLDHRHLARVVLVGHSMGGMVAQCIHALGAHRVQALVLSGTSPAFGKADGAWQQGFLKARLAPLDAGQGMAGLAPTLVRSMVAPSADRGTIDRAALMMAAVPEATYRAALKALMGFDLRAQLPTIKVPTLCLVGDQDPNASPSVMRAMADRIAHSEFVCLPGVGHLTNMEAPEAFNQALLDFLRRRVLTD